MIDLAEVLAGRIGRGLPQPRVDRWPPVAVLTMECQRGVIGDLSSFPELAEQASLSAIVTQTARLCVAARQVGAVVVHCEAEFAADGAGSVWNTPLHSAVDRIEGHLLAGSPAVELVPELGATDDDHHSIRRHGVAPFSGTDLDALLRSLGVKVVIATGVSLNLGVLGLCVEAVDLGYLVVVPADAVCGIPPSYARDVLAHTISLVATVTTTDAVIEAFSRLGPS